MRTGLQNNFEAFEPAHTKSEGESSRRGWLIGVGKLFGTALLTVAGGGVLLDQTREMHRQERLEAAKDQTKYGGIFWDLFQEIGEDLVEQDPSMEQRLENVRWREAFEPSIFHEVGRILEERRVQDIATKAVCEDDNMFTQAMEGRPEALKSHLRGLIEEELKHEDKYAYVDEGVIQTAGDAAMGFNRLEVDTSQLYPSHKPTRWK